MEPIVRVCIRPHRSLRRIAWLSAATWLWQSLAIVGAQETPAAAPPAVAAPTIDESQYDPPLTDKAKVDEWEKKQNGELRFKTALKVERLSNADREVLTKGLQNYLYRMTIKDERPNVRTIAQRLLESVNSPKLASTEARNFVNQEIVRIGQELMGQPPTVRLNVLILAASLASDPTTDPVRPFAGAAPLFTAVLEDPRQLVDSKIWAVKGLARIVRDGDIPVTERNRIAAQLVAALGAPDAKLRDNWWYRLRIVDALGDTGLVYDLQRQPIIIDALMSVLSDRREHWMIRATAARSVTQLPWLPTDNVNLPLVTHEICQFARDAAAARNATVNAPHWKYCFLCSYLSFNPQTAAQKQKNWGLLQKAAQAGYTQHGPLVQSAYQSLLPVVNAVMATKSARPINADEIKALDEWLQNNVPGDRKPTPSSKQVDQTERGVAPMARTE